MHDLWLEQMGELTMDAGRGARTRTAQGRVRQWHQHMGYSRHLLERQVRSHRGQGTQEVQHSPAKGGHLVQDLQPCHGRRLQAAQRQRWAFG